METSLTDKTPTDGLRLADVWPGGAEEGHLLRGVQEGRHHGAALLGGRDFTRNAGTSVQQQSFVEDNLWYSAHDNHRLRLEWKRAEGAEPVLFGFATSKLIWQKIVADLTDLHVQSPNLPPSAVVGNIGLEDLKIRYKRCRKYLDQYQDPITRYFKMDPDWKLDLQFSSKRILPTGTLWPTVDHFFSLDLSTGSRSSFFGSDVNYMDLLPLGAGGVQRGVAEEVPAVHHRQRPRARGRHERHDHQGSFDQSKVAWFTVYNRLNRFNRMWDYSNRTDLNDQQDHAHEGQDAPPARRAHVLQPGKDQGDQDWDQRLWSRSISWSILLLWWSMPKIPIFDLNITLQSNIYLDLWSISIFWKFAHLRTGIG